ERDDRWIFYAVVIMAPIGLLPILLLVPLSVRYFMISVAASLVLLSAGYPALLRREVAGLGIGLMLLAIFVAGETRNTGEIIPFRRGPNLAPPPFLEKKNYRCENGDTYENAFFYHIFVN